MSVPNSDFSQVSAITRKYFLPKLADNIFAGNPLLNRAKKKGWYKKIDGGSQVIMPVEYAVNGAATWFTGSDTIPLTDTDSITAFDLDWKQLVAPIVITRRDELMNMGQSQVVDFVKAKVKNAEKTLLKKMSAGLWSDGTTNSESVIGLPYWIATASTIGGISQSTSTWAAGQVDSTTTTTTLSAIQDLFSDCSEDNEQPTVMVGSKAVYNYIYSLLTPQMRFVDTETAKAGFTSIMINGVPVIADSNATASHLLLLNENYLHLLAHSQEDMRMTDWAEIDNQAVKVAKIYWAGVLGCSNPRFQGKFSALAA